MTYSSPNRMVWEFYNGAVNAALRAEYCKDQDIQKQDTMVCIILSITTVETFLNSVFRIIVTEPGYTQHEKSLLEDLRSLLSLDRKLKKWPKDILGNSLDLEVGIGKEFVELKKRRNDLMHFSSSHETFKLPDNVIIGGLANTQVFTDLTPMDAIKSISIIERFIQEIFRLKGVASEQIPQYLHFWTGKVASPGIAGH
jgi:hypothetical protein